MSKRPLPGHTVRAAATSPQGDLARGYARLEKELQAANARLAKLQAERDKIAETDLSALEGLPGREQFVGNAGLYYVCHRLSLLGWAVAQTARNARGIDVFLTDAAGKKVTTIHVKTANPKAKAWVFLGANQQNWIADYFVFCVLYRDQPRCYILTKRELQARAVIAFNQKDWIIEFKKYEGDLDAWHKLQA